MCHANGCFNEHDHDTCKSTQLRGGEGLPLLRTPPLSIDRVFHLSRSLSRVRASPNRHGGVVKLISVVVSFKEDNLSTSRTTAISIQESAGGASGIKVIESDLAVSGSGWGDFGLAHEHGSVRNGGIGGRDSDDDNWEGVESTEFDELYSAATAFVAASAFSQVKEGPQCIGHWIVGHSNVVELLVSRNADIDVKEMNAMKWKENGALTLCIPLLLYIDAYHLHFDIDFSISGEILGKLALLASFLLLLLPLAHSLPLPLGFLQLPPFRSSTVFFLLAIPSILPFQVKYGIGGYAGNEEKPVDSRKLAGLILKNALDAKEQHRKFELIQRWLSLDSNVKTQIKTCLLNTLSSAIADARSTSSQVIAKIAGIELPHKQWSELIGSLLLNVHQQSSHVKQATLETLGYLCEEVSPDVIDQDQVNKILTAVVQGMNESEGNNDVRLAATRSLYNALGFAQANFSNDMERDYIMRVVCEATLCPEVKIRQAAFECLVSIASTYYDKLARYIQDIFGITAKAVREDEEPVALQAIEFWSSICDEEIDILEEYGDDFTGNSDTPCFYFIKQALPALVPVLLETLLKQEEDQDQDEGAWNIAMAGGTCLGLVARTVGDDIVPLVMPFIEENITKSDWRQREAATYAFGSILEGPAPEKLMPIVNVALSFMLTALTQDPNNHVKDTTAWTLGRIFEFLHGSNIDTPIIHQANCQQIITVLLQSMKDVPNVAEKACGALYFLAQGYEDVGPASPLTPFFQEIVQSLLAVTHREDAGESRLRTAAYETLNEVVRCQTDETAPMVLQLVPVIMMELHNTLEGQKLSSDERERQGELQGLLCGCLQVLIQKLGSSEPHKYAFMQYADQIMGLFLRVFACRNATVHEEAMLAIGALAYSTGPDFGKYMTEFYKYLEMGLQNFEEYQVCAVTVGVVGDICRALEDKILPYCDGIMTQLLKNLSSDQLHRSVKPPIFSCFGDIALAIGENFEKYLMYAMPMLQRAAELSAHTAGIDDEMTEYTNSLRNGILEAYSGIFQGFKSSPKTQLLVPYAPHILQFLDSIYIRKDMDEVVMKTAIGVLGDLADTLGSNAGTLIQQSVSSKDFLSECLSSDDHLIKESAEWAKLAISRAISI
ncbi:Importin subunit beta-1, partial [Cucurbita argyrosperma subsp. sororia]